MVRWDHLYEVSWPGNLWVLDPVIKNPVFWRMLLALVNLFWVVIECLLLCVSSPSACVPLWGRSCVFAPKQLWLSLWKTFRRGAVNCTESSQEDKGNAALSLYHLHCRIVPLLSRVCFLLGVHLCQRKAAAKSELIYHRQRSPLHLWICVDHFVEGGDSDRRLWKREPISRTVFHKNHHVFFIVWWNYASLAWLERHWFLFYESGVRTDF